MAVGARDLPFLIRPGIPESTPVFPEQSDVGLSRQEPQVLHHYVFPGDFLGGEEGEAFPEVDLVVDVERREGIHARPVLLPCALLEHLADDVKISLQPSPSWPGREPTRRGPAGCHPAERPPPDPIRAQGGPRVYTRNGSLAESTESPIRWAGAERPGGAADAGTPSPFYACGRTLERGKNGADEARGR
jgi:hypothetical protein